ncbi:hypothetical protein Gogos_001912, partial [Gossypium gossypioides]|nr:hypothetical protein [Gossypium gossypioides]
PKGPTPPYKPPSSPAPPPKAPTPPYKPPAPAPSKAPTPPNKPPKTAAPPYKAPRTPTTPWNPPRRPSPPVKTIKDANVFHQGHISTDGVANALEYPRGQAQVPLNTPRLSSLLYLRYAKNPMNPIPAILHLLELDARGSISAAAAALLS